MIATMASGVDPDDSAITTAAAGRSRPSVHAPSTLQQYGCAAIDRTRSSLLWPPWRVHPRRSETGGLPSEALQSGVPEATTSVQNALAPTPLRSVEKAIEPAALELLTLLEVPMHLPVS